MKKNIIWIALAAMLIAACGRAPVSVQPIPQSPTQVPLPEKELFREEFEQDINKDWGYTILTGLPEQLLWSQDSGNFRMQLMGTNETDFVFLNKKETHKDVAVQAEFEYANRPDIMYAVICRATDKGWYEFRVSPMGTWELVRYDAALKADGKNPYSSFTDRQGGTGTVKAGKNIITLSCKGNQITGYVNGEQVDFEKRFFTATDSTYTEGGIGFALLGYGKTADVSINWLSALKP